MDEEKNRIALERISFHLVEALRLCTQLDFSGLGSLEQREWNDRIKICKNALEFTQDSVKKLNKILG